MAEKFESEQQQLEPQAVIRIKKSTDPLDEVIARKTMRRHVQDLVGIFAIILFGFAILSLVKHHAVANAGAATLTGLMLLLVGYKAPRIMIPVWRGWMALGKVLEVTTTLPLMWLFWVIVVVPTSLMARFRAKQRIDMTFREPVQSYWLSVDPKSCDFKLLERQY